MRSFWPLVLCSAIWACEERPTEPRLDSGTFSLLDQVDGASAEFDETHFRSIRKDTRLVNAVTLDGRTELAITPPIPSTFRYQFKVPDAPVLRFATAAATAGKDLLDASIELEIRIETAGEEGSTRVFSELIRRRAANQVARPRCRPDTLDGSRHRARPAEQVENRARGTPAGARELGQPGCGPTRIRLQRGRTWCSSRSTSCAPTT